MAVFDLIPLASTIDEQYSTTCPERIDGNSLAKARH